MTWREAMDRYGSDKPDVRFGMELVELTDVFADDRLQRLQGGVASRASATPGAAADTTPQPARRPDRLGQALGGQGPGVDAGRGRATTAAVTLNSPVAKFLSDEEQAGIVERLGAEVGDLLFLVADEWAAGRATCSACCAWSSAGPR